MALSQLTKIMAIMYICLNNLLIRLIRFLRQDTLQSAVKNAACLLQLLCIFLNANAMQIKRSLIAVNACIQGQTKRTIL